MPLRTAPRTGYALKVIQVERRLEYWAWTSWRSWLVPLIEFTRKAVNDGRWDRGGDHKRFHRYVAVARIMPGYSKSIGDVREVETQTGGSDASLSGQKSQIIMKSTDKACGSLVESTGIFGVESSKLRTQVLVSKRI